jgi:hypothetical protein
MTDPHEFSDADNLEDSDLGMWDAIPIDLGPTTPTPVAITPPPARMRLSAGNETPDPVSLTVEQSDVG